MHKTTKTSVSSIQTIIEIYKKDVDRTLIRENLKLTVEQRLLKLQNFQQFAIEIRAAGRKVRESKSNTQQL